MADETNRERDGGTMTVDARLDDYKMAIGNDADIMSDQRDKANEDMRFVNVTGGAWEGFLEDVFKDRAKMEFDLVSNFLFRFIGEWNLNRQGVKFKPDGDTTTDKDAELLNDIFRADFRDGSGKMAMDNAVYEAATCGYGAFKMATYFEDEGDPENERQRIEWRVINNAFNTVFWDQSAKRIDKKDARWVTVLTEFTHDSFKEAFPNFEPSSAYEPDSRKDWNWLSGASQSTVYVATRYEVIKKKESVFIYENMATGEMEYWDKTDHDFIQDELKSDDTREFIRERKIVKRTIEKSIFSGTDFLEKPKKVAGTWLPIIPVYGYRAFVDGAEWYFGLVRKLKDAARLFNMHMNQIAENSASNGQKIPIFDPDQMVDGVANTWADKTNKPYMLAKSLKDADGNPVHHGPTGYLDPGQLDGNTAASLQAVIEFIRDTTGGVPQDTMDPDASGKAIRAMTKRMNLNTQPVQDNVMTAIALSGDVYQGMAPDVYSREQMVRTLGMDGTDGQVHLLKMVLDEKTGTFRESNNLRGKKFRAYPDVGPQYDSMREETVENLKGIGDFLAQFPAGQQYFPALLAVTLENMEGVGLQPLKDMNRKNMLLMGLKKPETDEDKEFMAQQSEPKPDPQAELMQKMGQQAEAEAVKFQSQARNLDADSVKKVEEAKKTAAETAKLQSETKISEVKTLMDFRKEAFERSQQQAQSLPF
jgi:hypothetical protein